MGGVLAQPFQRRIEWIETRPLRTEPAVLVSRAGPLLDAGEVEEARGDVILRKLEKRVEEKGLTLIPVRVFFNKRGIVKIEIGICRGKKVHDKRAAIKAREGDREIRREISRYS